MNAVLQWVDQNPSAFKGFLASFCAALLKLILEFTGDSTALAQYNAVINQVLDLVISLIAGYFFVTGIMHARRGPALTSVDQAAAIVAALAPAPVATALEQVKVLSADIATVKPAMSQPVGGSHKF